MWTSGSIRFEKDGNRLLIESTSPIYTQLLHAMLCKSQEIYNDFLYDHDEFPEFEEQCRKGCHAGKLTRAYWEAIGDDRARPLMEEQKKWQATQKKALEEIIKASVDCVEMKGGRMPALQPEATENPLGFIGVFGYDFDMETACRICGRPFGKHICPKCGVIINGFHFHMDMMGRPITDSYFGGHISCP